MERVCPKHGVQRDKYRQCSLCRKEYSASKQGKEMARKYATSEKGKATRKKIDQKRRKRPEEKTRARAREVVHRAIYNGNLIRQSCLVCDNPKTEAHHAWGYSEEHLLHVIFLCREHHGLADKDSVFNETLKSKAPSSSRLG